GGNISVGASLGSADDTNGYTRCGERQSGDRGRNGSRAAGGHCCQGWAGAPGKGGDSRWLLAEQQRVVTLGRSAAQSSWICLGSPRHSRCQLRRLLQRCCDLQLQLGPKSAFANGKAITTVQFRISTRRFD